MRYKIRRWWDNNRPVRNRWLAQEKTRHEQLERNARARHHEEISRLKQDLRMLMPELLKIKLEREALEGGTYLVLQVRLHVNLFSLAPWQKEMVGQELGMLIEREYMRSIIPEPMRNNEPGSI